MHDRFRMHSSMIVAYALDLMADGLTPGEVGGLQGSCAGCVWRWQ